MKKLILGIAVLLTAGLLKAQVIVTGGSSATYPTLEAAFSAINSGLHTGAISVEITASTTETASAVLNSSGAGSASYSSIIIFPGVDGVIINGATSAITGRGVIELNGADNVTIDGDNPNTTGINRNLSVVNNNANTVSYTSVIRIATSGTAPYNDASNITIKNVIAYGNATNRNTSGTSSTTGSENATFGIICGPNGGATVSALTSVTGAMATGATANNLQISNCEINQVGRGIAFIGTAAASSSSVTIVNNQVGSTVALTGNYPYVNPVTTVYTKGIYVQGVTSVNISNNNISNILSYVPTTLSGVELNSSIGTGPVSIANNTITGVALNSTSASNAARGISVLASAGIYTIGSNVISNIQNNSASSSNKPSGIYVSTSAPSALITQNTITKVYNNHTGTWGASGLLLNAGNNITVSNNSISDVNQNYDGGDYGTTWNLSGMQIVTGTGHKLYHNSINMFGPVLGSGLANSLTSALCIVSSGSTGMDIRNNIFSNTMTGGAGSVNHVAIYLPSGLSSTYNLLLNNNAYYSGSSSSHGLAKAGTTFGSNIFTESNFNQNSTSPSTNFRSYSSTLGNATNDDASWAFSSPAPFASLIDLHIPNGTTSLLESKGASVGVSVDFDLDSRPGPAGSVNGGGTAPDIGVDEFDGVPVPACSGAPAAASIVASTVQVCAGGNASFSLSTTYTVTGITYQWSASTSSVGPFSPISNANLNTLNVSNVTSNTWYQAEIICAASSATTVAAAVELSVIALPVISASPTTTSICVPGSASVTINATGANSYSWSPSAGLSSTVGANVSALPIMNTTYTVLGEALGCVSSTTVSISVSAGAFVHSVSATPSVICSGLNSQLQTLGYGGGLINTYSFSTGTGAGLLSLTNATTVVASNVDDTPSGVFNLGFQINFNGQIYDQFVASPDGWVRFGGQAGSSQWTNSNTSTTNIPKLYPFWDDITTGIDGGVNASLEGTAPTRTMVVEWFVTIPANLSGNANSTFQALIHEATGEIEFRYGTMNATATSASSGMTGGSANYQAITFSTSATSTVSTSNSNVVTPASGTFFKFTPPSIVSWSPATFLSSTSVLSPTAVAATATTNYSVVITNAAGCTASGVVNLNVNPLPVITVNDGTICAGQSFSIVPSGAVSYTYLPTGPVVSPTSNDTYTVTGEDANGCVSAAAISSVNVNPLPVLLVSATNGTICEGGSTALNVSGANSYTWSTGATTSVTAVSPSVTITYTVDGESLGCVSSETVEVVVNALPSVSLSSSSANACVSGNTVALTGTPAGGVYTGSNVTNGVFTPGSSAGTYTANYSYTDPGTSCSNSASVSIVVNSAPSVSLTAATTTACVNGPTIALNGTPSGGVYSGTGVANGMFTPPATQGTYVAVYSYTDSVTGCDANANASIVVSVCTDISKANTALSGLQVYPNPNTGVFTIELNNGAEKAIVITDLTGRVIISEVTSNDKTNVSLNDFANGVYFVKITSNNAVETIRVIKQ